MVKIQGDSLYHTTDCGKTVPISRRASLNEAVLYVAFGRFPTDRKYEIFVEGYGYCEEAYHEATKELYYQILSGGITQYYDDFWVLFGDGMVEDSVIKRVPGDEEIYIVSNLFSYDDYNWNNSYAANFAVADGTKYPIQFDTAELIEKWPPKRKAESRLLGDVEYTTPYIEVMLRGIRQNNISAENQSQKESILVPWFEEELRRIGEKSPTNKAKMMATFIRLPESQRGGNKKLARKKG